MTRRSYAGGAAALTLSSGINAVALSISTTGTATGWPDGSGGKFLVVIDRGLATEEKVLCNGRVGNTLSVASTGDRGADGTTAATHNVPAAVEHVVGALDLDEPNAHINDAVTDVHPQYQLESGLTAAVAAAGYATTAATATAINAGITHYTGHTFAISGDVVVPSGDVDFVVPLFVPVYSGRTVKLVKARHRINAGTSATVKLQINGVDATGFTGISVTTSSADTNPADITMADGDKLALIVTAVSGSPKNLTFTCVLEHS